MKRIETTIVIGAPIVDVWEIVIRTELYREWNPFVKRIEGELKQWGKIKVHLQNPAGGTFTFSPQLLNADFPELRWRGKLGLPGLFDGEHYFRVEAIGRNQTRFVHGESFTGLLVPFMGKILQTTEVGFHQMNQALKQRAEKT